jgi:hypothetical protein
LERSLVVIDISKQYFSGETAAQLENLSDYEAFVERSMRGVGQHLERIIRKRPMPEAIALSEPLPNRIAEDPTIKGKGEDGECMDYAIAVSSRLAASGIHGRLIFYRWHIPNTEISGSHVFVMYRLPDGSEWIVDNEIPEPKEVLPEASPKQLVFLLSGDPSAPVDVELQNGLNHLSFF